MLAVAVLLAQGCATKSGSGSGEDRMAQEERIGEPAIKEIPPADLGVTASRTSPAMRAELSARNATGMCYSISIERPSVSMRSRCWRSMRNG
jgi:hypothetical protein